MTLFFPAMSGVAVSILAGTFKAVLITLGFCGRASVGLMGMRRHDMGQRSRYPSEYIRRRIANGNVVTDQSCHFFYFVRLGADCFKKLTKADTMKSAL